MDPWQLNAAKAPPPRKYLWHFYNQTAHYLENQVPSTSLVHLAHLLRRHRPADLLAMRALPGRTCVS